MGNNFFASDVTEQSLTAGQTLQPINIINGAWEHRAGLPDIICGMGGLYLITYSIQWAKISPEKTTLTCVLTLNGKQIIGSGTRCRSKFNRVSSERWRCHQFTI